MSKLDDWLDSAGSASGATAVIEPIFIAEVARADLRGYHPEELPERLFRLARASAGNDYAVVQDINKEWDAQFLRVLKSLKLRLVEDPSNDDFLLDDNVDGGGALFTGGWKVTEWKVSRVRNSKGDILRFTDQIKWVDTAGRIAFSSYDWKPYRGNPS
ncbi:hypothetical protein F3N42_00730 [Marinihelvus fidelis]|uniref:Uncharacterized protein n=1 Tax=Marinihelvus fidelis TaxID=2613842 RepID=A0A5N0TJL8_9GAMM|nr:hypothetical protein [Marinihelvus fidelis]KAA9134106.1 hypothetical protein F3N42_00730 [Marinihelvus fidelis]